MTLTVSEIQAKQFHVRFRGFDVEEVDAFLERAASALQAAQEEKEKLAGRLAEMEKELAGFKRQQRSFQNAIVTAQTIAEQMKEKSRQEAEELLAEARNEARRLQDEANGEVTALERELDRLRALKNEVQEELRRQLSSYLDMLEPQPFPAAAPQEASPVAVAAASLSRAAKEPQPDPWLTAVPDAAEEAIAEEAAPPAGAGEGEEDLSDLYTRIDLPDDALLEPGSHGDDLFGPASGGPAEREPAPAVAADEEEPAPLPDLDGDMVFTLEDPLDEEEPIVSLLEDDEEQEKDRIGKKEDPFSPDESPL